MPTGAELLEELQNSVMQQGITQLTCKLPKKSQLFLNMVLRRSLLGCEVMWWLVLLWNAYRGLLAGACYAKVYVLHT